MSNEYPLVFSEAARSREPLSPTTDVAPNAVPHNAAQTITIHMLLLISALLFRRAPLTRRADFNFLQFAMALSYQIPNLSVKREIHSPLSCNCHGIGHVV